MKSSLINSIGEVVTDYGARVMKVFKKGLLGRSLFDFYGDIKADALRTNETASDPSTPIDGEGGIIYTKSADGKLYYKSNEVSEIELSANGGHTDEDIQDLVGAMFTSNTETRISATYEDGDGTIDLVVDDMTADTNTQLSDEQVQDIVGGMVTGNTESGITVTYQDGDGTIDFEVGTLNQDTTGNAATATALTSGDKTIDGDLQVNGNDIKDNDGTVCITFDSSGNTTIAGTTIGNFSGNIAGVVTGSLVGNATGSSGSCTGNSATATSLQTARNIGGVSFNGTADINLPGVNASGSQDTSGNAATATALAAGNQTIDGDVTIGANGAGHDFKLYGDTSLATVLWDSTYDFLKFSDLTKIVFGSGVHASDFDSSIQANGSNLVIYNDTGNIQIGDTVEITGDLTTTGGIELGHASDTTIARSAAGEVTIEGKKIITENKVKQQFNLTFIDDIGTTQHYLSWRDQYENSSSTSSDYQDTNYLVPANGRVVAVYLRVGNITATSDMTVKVYSQNAGFMQSQSQQEAESTTITATGDKFEVFAFYFDNAEHFQAGDLVLISVQNGTDAGGSQTYHVTAVLEFDYTQMGRTDSGELA
jgi:hypothetical protein